jgi:hypothetical protein
MIGSNKDQMSPRYLNLSKLNDFTSEKELVRIKIEVETQRIIAALKLSLPLIQIRRQAFFLRDQFPNGTKFRNPEKISAIACYLYCIEHFIFINIKEYLSIINMEKIEFFKGIKAVFYNNRTFYRSLHAEEFRIKSIKNMAFRLKIHFDLPDDFMTLFSRYLDEYWNDLKPSKNTMVVAIIFIFIKKIYKESVSDRKICKFLGIASSNFSIYKKENDIEMRAYNRNKLYQDEKWLRKNYISKNKTQDEIGKMFGVSKRAIQYWLRIYNIKKEKKK